MKTTLDYKKDFLCVLTESEVSDGPDAIPSPGRCHALHLKSRTRTERRESLSCDPGWSSSILSPLWEFEFELKTVTTGHLGSKAEIFAGL